MDAQTVVTDEQGVTIGFAELVRCRGDRRDGGFAPGGRVSTAMAGPHHSAFGGRGMEFDETRVYRPGDDVRAIDWRVTARTGTAHTKLFHEERERPVLLLLDLRATMRFGTRACFKSVLGARVAAYLSWTAYDGGDRLGGFLIEDSGVRAFPSTRSRAGVLRWLRKLGQATRPPPSGGDGESVDPPSLAEALSRLRRAARPGSLVFVVGDFADLDERAEHELVRLRAHAHFTAILVHDPLEATLPARGDLVVGDGRQVLALGRPGSGPRRAWESLFNERRTRLENLSRRHGIAWLSLATDEEAATVLHPHAARRAA